MDLSPAPCQNMLYASCGAIDASGWNTSSPNTSSPQPFQVAGKVCSSLKMEPERAWRPGNQASPPRSSYQLNETQSHSARAKPDECLARASTCSYSQTLGAGGATYSRHPHNQRQGLWPNQSLKRSANGMPPGPGLRYAVHFLSPGPGVIPLSPA